MSAPDLPRDDDPSVVVLVNGRTYQLHYQRGVPVWSRRILPNGEPCNWWLLADQTADSEHSAAARKAEQFLGQWRLPAVAS